MKFRKILLVLMVAIVLLTPVMLSAQMGMGGYQQDACMQAKMDAQRTVNGSMWFAVGCLLTFPLGWPILPMIVQPEPPATSLLGKSSDYVATYTACYKTAATKIVKSKSLNGCIVGSLVQGGCWTIYILAIMSASSGSGSY